MSFYLVNARDRYEALKRLPMLIRHIFSSFVVPKEIHKLFEKLVEDGYSAAALHEIYLKRNVMV
jgi:ATP-dependent RNA helicase DeaD